MPTPIRSFLSLSLSIAIVCPVYGQSAAVRDASQNIVSAPTLFSFGPDIPSVYHFRNRLLEEGLGAAENSEFDRISLEIAINGIESKRMSGDLERAQTELAAAKRLSLSEPGTIDLDRLFGRNTLQRNFVNPFVDSNGTKNMQELGKKIGEWEALAKKLEDALKKLDDDNKNLQAQLKVLEAKQRVMDKNLILIEAKIISIDTSDDRTLGVEIGGGDRSGAKRLFAFSSFGLSAIDGKGNLALDTGKNLSGINGALVNPDTADVIVRALAQNTHVKVESSPRVLVKNTKQAAVISTLGTPYEATLSLPNLGVAEAKFGGYASSGTIIDVIPEVRKTDENGPEEIHLSFLIKHSNNVNSPKDKLPPAIHSDVIQSQVRIPDKHTVIVGGLNRYGTTKEQQGIPGLMHIPLIKHIASYQKDSHSRTTLFFFITASIIDPADHGTGKYDKLKYVNTPIPGLHLVPME